MADEKLKLKIDTELDALGDIFVILINANSKDYFESVLETLKVMTDRGMSGVYLTAARPYDYILKSFEKYNINHENLFFIDTISCMAGRSAGEHGKCVFIENPSALEEVSMWTNVLMDRIENKKKVLIIDSLSTLLIYNDSTALTKFSQMLINRLRIQGSSGIFTAIDTEVHEGFQNTLTALCDKIIKF